jgi:hypothetical protein
VFAQVHSLDSIPVQFLAFLRKGKQTKCLQPCGKLIFKMWGLNYISDKGLITRIYRELKNLNSPKTNEPIKKWASELNRTFSKEEIQMARKTHEKMLTISSNKGNAN